MKYLAAMLSCISFTVLSQQLISIAIKKKSSLILEIHHNPPLENFSKTKIWIFQVNRISGRTNQLSSNNAVLFVYMLCMWSHDSCHLGDSSSFSNISKPVSLFFSVLSTPHVWLTQCSWSLFILWSLVSLSRMTPSSYIIIEFKTGTINWLII